MDEQKIEILTVRQARRLFTDGDIKSEVAFQHEVNRLLASLEDLCDSAERIAFRAGLFEPRRHDGM